VSGKGKSAKYELVDCDVEWTRCSTGAHSHDHKYIVCKTCRKHPGAVPGDLEASDSDDDGVPTAESLGIPWPETLEELTSKTQLLAIGREDDQAVAMDAEGKDQQPQAIPVDIWSKKESIRFMYSEKEYKTKPERWIECWDSDGVPYYEFQSNETGLLFYTYNWVTDERATGGEGSSKGKKKKK